jgi:hypothetical protein
MLKCTQVISKKLLRYKSNINTKIGEWQLASLIALLRWLVDHQAFKQATVAVYFMRMIHNDYLLVSVHQSCTKIWILQNINTFRRFYRMLRVVLGQ